MEDQSIKEANQMRDDDIPAACLKERWEREKQILLDGKQWCMEEISRREKKLNEMRIEMIKIESKMQQELISLSEEKEALSQNLSRLNESLAEKEQALAQLREKLQQIVEERATNLNEVDAELRARERLANVYKASLDAANNEISILKEDEEQLRSQIKQADNAVANLNAELKLVNADREKESMEKDKTIRALKEEVNLANTILKTGARSHRDNVSAFSSVAASAASRIGMGTTSSLLYADYGRIKDELDRTNQEKKQLEEYVRELLEEIEVKAPQFVEQTEQCKHMTEELTQLRFQNELMGHELERLQNSRDAATRELKYTKTDLDRYIAENKQLSLQISKLLYAIETNSSSARFNASPREEQSFFNNIQELQRQNINLTAKLRQLESGHQQDRDTQTSFQSSGHILKLESSVQELTTERDTYKSLLEELEIKAKTVQEEKASLEQVQKDSTHWKARAEFLKEKLDCFNQEKQQVENSLNAKIDQQLEQIGQHRITNGKLESSLEFQKCNQQLMHKQMIQLEEDLKKANESAMKATVRVQLQQEKIDELASQLLQLQQQAAMSEQAAVEESSMATELDELRQQLEVQVEQISQLTSVNEELGSALDMAEKNADQLEQQVNELQDRLKQEDRAKSEIQSSAANVENSFAEFVKKSEAEKKDLSARFLAAVEEVEQFKLTVDKNAAILKQTKTLAIKFRNSNAELEKENATLKDDIEKLKQEVTLTSSGKSGDMRHLLQERIQDALKITGEKKDLTIKLSELMKEKDALTINMCKLKTDLEEANANCTHLDTITAAFEESQKQIETLQEALNKKDDELVELNRILGDAHSASLVVDQVNSSVSRKRPLTVSESMPAIALHHESTAESNLTKRVKTDANQESSNPVDNEVSMLESSSGDVVMECRETLEEGSVLTSPKESKLDEKVDQDDFEAPEVKPEEEKLVEKVSSGDLEDLQIEPLDDLPMKNHGENEADTSAYYLVEAKSPLGVASQSADPSILKVVEDVEFQGYSIADSSIEDDNDSIGAAADVDEDVYNVEMIDQSSSETGLEFEIGSDDEQDSENQLSDIYDEETSSASSSANIEEEVKDDDDNGEELCSLPSANESHDEVQPLEEEHVDQNEDVQYLDDEEDLEAEVVGESQEFLGQHVDKHESDAKPIEVDGDDAVQVENLLAADNSSEKDAPLIKESSEASKDAAVFEGKERESILEILPTEVGEHQQVCEAPKPRIMELRSRLISWNSNEAEIKDHAKKDDHVTEELRQEISASHALLDVGHGLILATDVLQRAGYQDHTDLFQANQPCLPIIQFDDSFDIPEATDPPGMLSEQVADEPNIKGEETDNKDG